MDDCMRLLERLASLARLKPDPEYCEDIESIRSFLDQLSEARSEVEGLDPLYHVWEESSRLREGGEKGYPKTSVSDLLPPDRVDQGGHVKLPWKGRA